MHATSYERLTATMGFDSVLHSYRVRHGDDEIVLSHMLMLIYVLTTATCYLRSYELDIVLSHTKVEVKVHGMVMKR